MDLKRVTATSVQLNLLCVPGNLNSMLFLCSYPNHYTDTRHNPAVESEVIGTLEVIGLYM